jgi:hypothetical protein
MKDSRTVLLLVVSLCLVGTWVYHLYDKNQYATTTQPQQEPYYDSNQVAINDSLRMRYLIAVSDLDDVKVGKDSLNMQLNAKVTEIDSLRNEVNAILAINDITKEDLRKAEEKINQLQQKVQQATRKDSPLNNEVKNQVVSKKVTANLPVSLPETKTVNTARQNVAAPALLNTANISFKAMKYEAGEQSTTRAQDAGSFIVTCQLQNSTASISNTEVYIVLTDPGSSVIQDDQWQAGMFQSNTSGRIPYTRKSGFNYTKGETKRIAFSIKPSEIVQGMYTVQIYHNGSRIGRASLRLN